MALFQDCKFFVQDGSFCSETYSQDRGICQGCPLSPYLFIVLLSSVLADVSIQFQNSYGYTPWVHSAAHPLQHLEFADDTALMSRSHTTIHCLLHILQFQASKRGLLLNPDKCQLLRLHTDHDVSLSTISPRRVLVSVNNVGALIHCPILARWWTILHTLALFLMPLLPLLLTACAVSARPPQFSDPSSHFSPTNPSPLKGDCNYITRLFWQYCCTVLSHKHTLQHSSRDSTRCTSRFCVKYLASKVRIITGFLPPLQIIVPMLF